jgi:16S rRNA (uracil1498-N3)-methyltransferase
MKRFFIQDQVTEGQQYVITGSEGRHIARVLRLGPTDRIVAFDGSGYEYHAEIQKVSRDGVRVAILRKYPSRPESPARITVAQALLKGKKMDTLLRQMTELGVAAWVPFSANRSVPNPDNHRKADRLERWQAIVKEALKQCRRGEFTRIHPLASFQEMLSMAPPEAVKLIFWENASQTMEQGLCGFSEDSLNVWIVLGPEGGFTEGEIQAAAAAGFEPVSLGSRILRAETASLAACVLMQYLFGDMGP